MRKFLYAVFVGLFAFVSPLYLAHEETARPSKFEDVMRHYHSWWYGPQEKKTACIARMRELTDERSFAITSVFGNETDWALRDEHCLDKYSHLFGSDLFEKVGTPSMTADSSIEHVGKYLFVHITSFMNPVSNIVQLVEGLGTARDSIEVVVLDVRGNQGGGVGELRDLLNDLFSPGKGIEYLKPNGKMTYAGSFVTDRTGLLSGKKIRILTDEDSASASEWMIETLCYEWYPRSCETLGTKTYGKAILQCSKEFKYPDQHFKVKLTCAEWFLVNKRKEQDRIVPEKVQEVGITPDKPMTFKDCDRYAYSCIAHDLADAGL